jgi:hypothetical protein
MPSPRRSSPDLLDALVWLIVSILLLSSLHIGYISADGFGQSAGFAAGPRLNPNHLFFDPLGAGWLRLLGAGISREEAVDHLKRLSILFGALAVALFRRGVAPRVAADRFAANHATAWVALSSAFSRLWISDEIHMIQMPAVVAVAVCILRWLERQTLWRAVWLGAAATLAAAFFLSNILLAPAAALVLGLWHLRQRERRQALTGAGGILIGAAASALLVFPTAWLLSGAQHGFLSWVTSYAGGDQPSRVKLAYGMLPSLSGVEQATVRALYGAACALVDLAPAVATIRDRQPVGWQTVASLAAFAAAVAVLLYSLAVCRRAPAEPANRNALLLTAIWLLAVLAFGILWDNSDDQFYFQLAVVFGALAGLVPVRKDVATILVLSTFALLWNGVDLASRRVLYPRRERVALLRAGLRDACLVVYPGHEDLAVLLTLSQSEPPVPRLAITSLAVAYPLEKGRRELSAAIDACLSQGRPVALIDIFDTPADKNPWKFLRRLGYERSGILATVEGFPVEPQSRLLGPFTLRWVRSKTRR